MHDEYLCIRSLSSKFTIAADPDAHVGKRRPAVSYVRVSSKEQEKEGFSIPAQRKLLAEYADQNALEIVQEFETAKRAGRSAFNEMVETLRATRPSASIILVEKTDRLYRNIKDWVTIADAMRLTRGGRTKSILLLSMMMWRPSGAAVVRQ